MIRPESGLAKPGRDRKPLFTTTIAVRIDFADVLDYKDRLMYGETPRCLTVDLNDPVQRRAMYEAGGSAPALMITEGLLLYLPAATVEALAEESRIQSGVRHWISDVTTSAFSRVLGEELTRPGQSATCRLPML